MNIMDKLFLTAVIIFFLGVMSIKIDRRTAYEVPDFILFAKVVPTVLAFIAMIVLLLLKIWI